MRLISVTTGDCIREASFGERFDVPTRADEELLAGLPGDEAGG
jgi:hypothetical protein